MACLQEGPNEEKISSTASIMIASKLPTHDFFFFSRSCSVHGVFRFIVYVVYFHLV
jgi:hypothetical protein